jgi:hypothetical protein
MIFLSYEHKANNPRISAMSSKQTDITIRVYSSIIFEVMASFSTTAEELLTKAKITIDGGTGTSIKDLIDRGHFVIAEDDSDSKMSIEEVRR